MARFRRGDDEVVVDPTLPPSCRRVQTHLPRLVADEASWARTRWVERHLQTCGVCRDEARRQAEVDRRLRELAPVVEAQVEHEAPPDWLLDRLLEQAAEPDLRARAAVPARGAVSGARPGLTVGAVLLAAALGALVGWAVVRAVHDLRPPPGAPGSRRSRRGHPAP